MSPAGASTLGKDDVERMVKEAEKFANEDKKRREAVDTKNQVCYACILL
jgi:molecular chaperone DnaK